MSDLTVVCFFWKSENRKFTHEHVNILHRMIRRNESVRHRFVCVTDEAGEYDEGIEVFPMPDGAKKMAKHVTPDLGRFHCAPSCYRRLWLFSEDAKVLGDRVLQLDLDCVVLGDIAKLGKVDGDFVAACREVGDKKPIPGFCYMVRSGVFPDVAKVSSSLITKVAAEGWRGSDQAIISYHLADRAIRWGNKQVYMVSSQQAREHPHKDAIVVAVTGLLGKPYNEHVAENIPWWSLYYR